VILQCTTESVVDPADEEHGLLHPLSIESGIHAGQLPWVDARRTERRRELMIQHDVQKRVDGFDAGEDLNAEKVAFPLFL
jgi:hypothetical protein